MVERKGQEKREVRRCDVEGGKKTERFNPTSNFCLQRVAPPFLQTADWTSACVCLHKRPP